MGNEHPPSKTAPSHRGGAGAAAGGATSHAGLTPFPEARRPSGTAPNPAVDPGLAGEVAALKRTALLSVDFFKEAGSSIELIDARTDEVFTVIAALLRLGGEGEEGE